ncbi:MAG: acetyltransferase [Archangiaceae bacterium]|nr:acetyltransferase [Archangiaceae bacterium]
MRISRGLTLSGHLWTPGPGRVYLGRGVTLRGSPVPIELRAHAGAEIVIDDGAVIESGTSIEATRSVVIGKGARIGPLCKIMDNNFHRTSGDRLARPEGVPVVIGAHAVIGPYAIVLPGGSMEPGAHLKARRVLSFHMPRVSS